MQLLRPHTEKWPRLRLTFHCDSHDIRNDFCFELFCKSKVMGQWSKCTRKGSWQLRYTTAGNRAHRQSKSPPKTGQTAWSSLASRGSLERGRIPGSGFLLAAQQQQQQNSESGHGSPNGSFCQEQDWNPECKAKFPNQSQNSILCANRNAQSPLSIENRFQNSQWDLKSQIILTPTSMFFLYVYAYDKV